MTLKEVATIVDYEGLGYAIESYMSKDEIDDPILKEKWNQVAKLLKEIREILPDPYQDCDEYEED